MDRSPACNGNLSSRAAQPHSGLREPGDPYNVRAIERELCEDLSALANGVDGAKPSTGAAKTAKIIDNETFMARIICLMMMG